MNIVGVLHKFLQVSFMGRVAILQLLCLWLEIDCIRNSLQEAALEPLEHSAYLDGELEVTWSLHKPEGNPYTGRMKAFALGVATPGYHLPSRIPLKDQAQAVSSLQVAACVVSYFLSSCFQHSLSVFSWSEQSLNEMFERHLKVCSGNPGTRQISASYNCCLNKWNFIFCMQKNEVWPSLRSIYKQFKID